MKMASMSNEEKENELSLTENLRRSVMKKIDKLLTNQVAVATSFENVYNNLTEFPKVAIEVRVRAVLSRELDKNVLTLFKGFCQTSECITHKLLDIEECIENKGTAVMKAHFQKILEWSKNMENKANATRDDVQKLILEVNKTIEVLKTVRTEREKNGLRVERKEVNRQAKESDLGARLKDVSDIDVELGMLEISQQKREAYMKTWKGRIWALFKSQKTLYEFVDKIKETEHLLKITLETKGAMDIGLENVNDEIDSLKNEHLRGNDGDLLNASKTLGNLDQDLSCLSTFWGEMAVFIGRLSMDTSKGEPYIEDLETPANREKLQNCLSEASEIWLICLEEFRQYCKISETDPERSNVALYKFLD